MSRPTIIATPALFITRRTRYRVRKMWGEWRCEEWLILESTASPSWSRTEAMLQEESCGRGLSGWHRALVLANERANAQAKAPRVEPPC